MSIIEFAEVRRAYRAGANVLDGVSFTVDAGEVVGLLGRNGAGKTTLMRIAMGMIEPQRGTTRVLGLDPRRDPVRVKARVGYVSEDQILPEFLHVAEVIRLHEGLFPSWNRALEQRLLSRFDVPADRKVRHLSKGQARQLALLCAVCHEPELLLLDEPAGGLDPAARREFLETAIEHLNERGSTILFSSHHMMDVERLAGRVVMLEGGAVLLDAALDDLREQHALAMVPANGGATRDSLLTLEGCLGVRERSDALHAVFALDPDRSCALLERELGITNARCTSVPLEEMFIELVGGRR